MRSKLRKSERNEKNFTAVVEKRARELAGFKTDGIPTDVQTAPDGLSEAAASFSHSGRAYPRRTETVKLSFMLARPDTT